MPDEHVEPIPGAIRDFPEPTGRTPPDLAFWVGLGAIRGVSSGTLWRLHRRFQDMSRAWTASRGELRAAGLDEDSASDIEAQRSRLNPDEELGRLEALSVRALAWDDPGYPAQLRQIPDPPPLLYVRGDLGVAGFERSVAIVGTRRLSAYGLQVTERIAQGLAQAGICVISGMAVGIDSAAHRAALEAGGPTVAVWGTGFRIVYPPENHSLAQEIVKSGALVTEYPLWMRASKENFPQRNRIISGLARGIVVVEAPLPSGALITARYALEHNREIMAVPGDVFSAQSQGANRLLFRGEARAVTSAEDVLETLGIAMEPRQLTLEPLLATTEEERGLLQYLDTTPKHIDALARAAALPAPKVSAILSIMEINGLVRHMGAGTYVAARRSPGGGAG